MVSSQSPVCSMELTPSNIQPRKEAVSSLAVRSREKSTSSMVMALPSEKVTSSRIWKT